MCQYTVRAVLISKAEETSFEGRSDYKTKRKAVIIISSVLVLPVPVAARTKA